MGRHDRGHLRCYPATRNLEAPMKARTLAAALVLFVAGSYVALAQQGPARRTPMTFFVTSVPIGDGGNLGGLAGADAHCQVLATAVGAGNRTWHAYLSTPTRHGQLAA